MMKVKDVIKELSQADPEAYVVIHAPDHSYASVNFNGSRKETGLFSRSTGWTEDYGEDITPEADYGKRLPIVVIC